ncbi:MAG: EAL domain-containing protein [Leptospiraceae bacterium]|nr:EAL domain-containing protein [Leptospiraceae bacterium]
MKVIASGDKLNRSPEEWIELLDEGSIVPFFQPILSIENKSVFGYESLARLVMPDGSIKTIGEFFLLNQSEFKSDILGHKEFRRFQRSIDQKLREQALHLLANDPNQHSKLFLNISPAIMMSYIDGSNLTNELPSTIRNVKEFGISPERIVIEVTEDYIHKNLEALKPLINLYKDFGFLIAIDDLGSKSSNLDRIGIFRPDIIKVDMQMLRMSLVERSYKEILYTLSRLGESLGISLLFEGVETVSEMYQAMSFGSRYLQGFLFDRAMASPPEKNKYTNQLNGLVDSFYSIKIEEIKQKVNWESRIEVLIQKIADEIQFHEDGTLVSYSEVFTVDETIFRFFVTDLHGNQASPNYIKKKNSEIVIQRHTRNNNWSWRPYFLNHLYESYRQSNSWVISQPYHDIMENLLLRTFSKTFKDKFILFIDVLYSEG